MYKFLLLLLLFFPILLFSTTDSTIIITGDKNYAPYTYLDANGEPKGMLVDMWKEYSKVTGSKIKFDFKDWVQSIEDVKNKKADIHSGLYIKEDGLFEAKPIHTTKISLFAKEDYTKKLDRQTIGVIEPSYGDKLKKEYPNIRPIVYKNYDLLFGDVNSGKLDLFFDATEAVLNASTITEVDALADLVSMMSKMVHSLQQERGASSGYISSNGKEFKSKLEKIVKNSDLAKQVLLVSLNINYELLEKHVKVTERDSLNTLFNELFALREDVKNLKVSFAHSYSKYTQIIAYLLLNISDISDKAQNKELIDELYTYSTLLMYKESIGQKRAALSALFSQKVFSKEIFEYFLTSDTQEKIYLKNFLHNADKKTKDYYAKTLDSDVTKKVSEYEKLALKKLNGETVDVNPEKWFETVTKKINLVQDVEHYVFKDILVSIDNIKRKNISSYKKRTPYVVVPLKQEYFYSMYPATHDKKLIGKINNGFSKIPKSKFNEIENRWINTKNKYYSLFTLEELTWIKKHKSIKVGVEHWDPVVFSNNGKDIDGIASDYTKEIQKLTGLNIEVVAGIWDNLLTDFKNKKIDVLPATYYTKERATYGRYTSGYLKMKDYIYVRKDVDNIKSLKDLEGKKLAIIKGYGTIPKIKEKYPNIKLVLTANMDESFNFLLDGSVDAMFEGGAAVEKKINDEFITGLKGFAATSFKTPELHFFSKMDEPILHSILQKSLDSISEKDKDEINSKWFTKSLQDKKSNELNIAFHYDRAPFMFGKTSAKGIEADLVKEILESQGYKVNIHQMTTENMNGLLDTNHDFDAISSVKEINDGMFYSKHFISYENYAITRKSDNIKIEKLRDLGSVKFTAWKGAYNDLGDEFYKLFNPKDGYFKHSYNDLKSQTDQHQMFFNKKVDAIVVDKTIFQWYKMAYKITDEYSYHKIFPELTSYPAKFRSQKVRDDFNKGLQKIKASGRYEEIVDFYISQDIRTLLKYTNLMANISGKFVFTNKKQELNNILHEFFQHPDIVHIDVFDTINNKVFTSLASDDDIKDYQTLPSIKKNIYFSNVDSTLHVGRIEVFYKKDFDNKKGDLVPRLTSFVGFSADDYKTIEKSYEKLGFSTDTIILSKEEKEWIKEHPVVKFTGDPNWLPFEAFNSDGEYIGIVSDYLKKFEIITGIKFERIPTASWSDSVKLSESKGVDVLSEITESNREHLIFTKPYIQNEIVIVMNNTYDHIESLESIKKKKIALIKDYGYVDKIKKAYPDIAFVSVNTIQDGLSAVSTGKVDAMVCTFALGSYTITQMGISNIKIVGKTKFSTELGLGVRKDYAPLVSILNKAIDSIDEQEHNDILNNWIKQDYVEVVDYSLLWKGGSIALFLLIFIVFWNRKMAKEISKRKEIENELKDSSARMSTLFDSSPDSISILDEHGNYVDCNEATLKIFGIPSKEKLLQLKPSDMSPELQYNNQLSSEQVQKNVAIAFEKGMCKFEWIHKRVDTGIAFDTEVVMSVVYLNSRPYIYGVVRDITKIKKAQQELKEIQDKQRLIIEKEVKELTLKQTVQLKEIQKFQALTVGREGRMIELKELANDLSLQLNNQVLYDIHIDEDKLIDTEEDERELEINEIIDIPSLQGLLDNFCNSIEIASAIIDLKGNVLASSRWQRACTHFHRVNESSCANCIQSDTDLSSKLEEGEEYSIYKCNNGLVDCASPIIINGKHIANVFIGQFLIQKPDILFFTEQSEKYGYDQSSYLEAIKEVPIIDEEKLPFILKFLSEFTKIITSLSMEKLKADKSELINKKVKLAAINLAEDANLAKSELIKHQEHLEELIQERTKELNKTKSNLENVSNAITDLIFYKDLELRYTGANKAFCIFMGLSEEEIIGKTDFEIFEDQEIAQAINDFDNEVIKSGESKYFEERAPNAKGELKILSTQKHALRDKTGNVYGMGGSVKDITDLKRAQEEITQNKLFVDTLLNSQEQIVITTDGDILKSCNDSFLELFDLENMEEFIKDYDCICDKFEIDETNTYLQKYMGELSWIEYILANQDENHKVVIIKDEIEHTFTVTAAVLPIGDGELKSAVFTNITEMENAKQEVETINKHTRESIEYASLIQSALIPDTKSFQHYFQDYFAIWQPKDIVGGDIYLFEELRDKDECLLMVIDCTGHGVPGAFVTMLVKAIERQIIAKINNDVTIDVSPGWILSYFNRKMKILLKQESADSVSNAGFDGGVIYYNKKEKVLKFAGAETPLFYTENEELKTIKGSRHSIGYKKSDPNFEFKDHIVEVKEGMQFYCATDGYLDQNGGEKSFPFGKKRFAKLIEEYTNEPFVNKKDIFLNTLEEYQGDDERNDDITLVGFKI